MEYWSDQGIVLSVRPYGEGAAIVKIFSSRFGLHAGYVYGAQSKSKRPLLEPGNLLNVSWQAKTHEQLGTYSLEMIQQFSAMIMEEGDKLSALHAACSLLSESLPERESHVDLFQATNALITIMANSEDILIWGEAYIKWEIALLRELGFSLDFSRCAGGGSPQELAYISPKSGCAVSYEKGELYRDKLLPLPSFLKPNGGPPERDDILKGLNLTETFLEKWAFAHHTQGIPEARRALGKIFSQ